MPNLLNTAMTWLNSTLQQSAGDVIVYQRGSSTVSITAVVGATDGERMDAGGMAYSFTSKDFMIEASDLVLDGEIVVPSRGDRITYGGRSYTVVVMQTGEQPYRESGTGSSVYRVHTKLTGET